MDKEQVFNEIDKIENKEDREEIYALFQNQLREIAALKEKAIEENREIRRKESIEKIRKGLKSVVFGLVVGVILIVSLLFAKAYIGK